MLLAICLDVRVVTPTEKPGMVVWLYLPDMNYSLLHTISERVDEDRLEIKALLDVYLASRMTRCSLG
jgi:hypothetical protein